MRLLSKIEIRVMAACLTPSLCVVEQNKSLFPNLTDHAITINQLSSKQKIQLEWIMFEYASFVFLM